MAAEWDVSVRLAGDVVALEPLRPEHEDGLVEAAAFPEAFTWWPLDLSEGRDEVRAFIEWALKGERLGERQHYATVDARSGEVIGSTSYFLLQPEHRTVEIGATFLTPSRWRSGANTEAKLLMLRYAFDVLGCQRVQIVTDALNEQSRAAILSLGAQFEGIHRQDRVIPRSGRVRDSAFYSIIDSEWQEVERGLTGRSRSD
jgi:RimJ/RimL family protein N-acetyltransferase